MISNEDLAIARRMAAEVVQKMGDKYWPIFEMVDVEWSRRRERRERLGQCLSETAALPPGQTTKALPGEVGTGPPSGSA